MLIRVGKGFHLSIQLRWTLRIRGAHVSLASLPREVS